MYIYTYSNSCSNDWAVLHTFSETKNIRYNRRPKGLYTLLQQCHSDRLFTGCIPLCCMNLILTLADANIILMCVGSTAPPVHLNNIPVLAKPNFSWVLTINQWFISYRLSLKQVPIQKMTPEWPWALHAQKPCSLNIPAQQAWSFYSVLLYDQLFSRYNYVPGSWKKQMHLRTWEWPWNV